MNKTVRIILICLLTGVFIYAGYMLLGEMREYREAEEIYEESRRTFVLLETLPDLGDSTSIGTKTEDELAIERQFPHVQIDFDTLMETNGEIVAWIWVPETNISFPLLKTVDNMKYVHVSYNLQYNSSGAIFMDARNSANFADDNSIVFGHNMKNGTMFGSLKNYREQDYLANHKTIFIFTPEKAFMYEVFAAYETNATSEVYTCMFETEELSIIGDMVKTMENGEYLDMIKENTLIDSDIWPEMGERLITLSTCAAEWNSRFVIHGVLIAQRDM
jgi:sortase, SrtB family